MVRFRRVGNWGYAVAAAALVVVLTGCGGATQTTEASSPSSAPPPGPSPIPPATDSTPPAVSITVPTSSGSYSTTSTPISLSGTASDNIGVDRVTWRNNTTGSSGDASGTSSWNAASIALVAGTNVLVVTAQDGAGNSATATVSVTYNAPQSSLSGNVDSSLIDRNGANAVYLYAGSVTPGDQGGTGAQPLAIASVTQDSGACTWSYRFGSLPVGTYTVAFTNQAAADDPLTGDTIAFVGTTSISTSAVPGTIHNFTAAHVLHVGPTRSFDRPSAAAAVAQDGDVIEIDAGVYDSDAAVWSANRLTLRGVGGRAYLRANGVSVQGKGTWVIAGDDASVENIEFSGATVTDHNGAGIRADGNNLVVCNGYFHDNEEGILGGSGDVLIEYTEFSHNGNCINTSGCAHNIYMSNSVQRFTLRYSYSHHAHEGHNVKSRAHENYILYNRIMDETDGDSSYDVDLPDCGRSFLIGNLIQQGPNTANSSMVAYGAEACRNGTQELYAVNNTFVNDRGSGEFLNVRSGTTGKVTNNIFAGGGTVVAGPQGLLVGPNLVTDSPGLVGRSTFDYRLTAASPARDAGADPGSAAGESLVPTSQYVHPANREDRPIVGTIDIGAYEYSP